MHLDDFATVEDIMNIGLQIPYEVTTQVFWPSLKRTRNYQVHHYATMDYTYNINRYVLIIRMPDYVYITPIVCGWESILETSNLRKERLFVPFSNGDYPIEYESFWSKLNDQIWHLRNEHLLREDAEREKQEKEV